LTDAAGVILTADDACAQLLESRREFLIGKPLGLFVKGQFRADFYERLARQRYLDRAEVFETRLGGSHGKRADVLVTLFATSRDERGAFCYRWLLRDIGDVRRVEKALQAERQLLDSAIDAAQAIILVLDPEGLVLRSNAYLHAVTGVGAYELHGRPWFDVLLPADRRPPLRRMVIQATTRGVARSEVVPLPTRAGAPRDVVWSARRLPEGVAGAVVLVGHDVTELQEAQRQALQAERLATIGRVAAGLAHEGRNALQRIQACLSMLALRARDNPEVLDLIGRAEKAQDDLHHLFEDVRSYSAIVQPQRVAADLGAAWREAWADVAAVHAAKAELAEDVGGADLACEIDPFQIKRVFRNLFENSLETGADRVQVTVRCPPSALEVVVRDNGPGFPPDARRRLFEPFFTTRIRGTGLGLAISRRVVEAHGGQIEAGPEGPGAEVRITLPRRAP
jgi:PAS domain S-box-containing protein